MTQIKNKNIYLKRLAKPLGDKLKIAQHFPKNAKTILDAGCADGALTIAFAKKYPNIKFLGIDLDKSFIEKAQQAARKENLKNVEFENIYLRDLLLDRSRKFDAVLFVSVLHEFYTYGEGISSVMKAVADAHELLPVAGRVIIRDMILEHYTESSAYTVEEILKNIKKQKSPKYIKDFEKNFGKINNLKNLNHFLLKYSYTENWDREVKENYVPVTSAQYEDMFSLLGMNLEYKHSYLLDYFKNKWKKDFNLTDQQISPFYSTTILAAKKI